MDDWYESVDGVVKKKPDKNYLQHHQTINFLTSTLNNNNGISEKIRWDSTSQATLVDQSNINILLT